MAGGRGFSIEGGKSIHVKEWELENGNNLVTPWYTGS